MDKEERKIGIKEIRALLPLIKDIAIILVCVLILVGSIHYGKYRGFYIAFPVTSKYFDADISGSVDTHVR